MINIRIVLLMLALNAKTTWHFNESAALQCAQSVIAQPYPVAPCVFDYPVVPICVYALLRQIGKVDSYHALHLIIWRIYICKQNLYDSYIDNVYLLYCTFEIMRCTEQIGRLSEMAKVRLKMLYGGYGNCFEIAQFVGVVLSGVLLFALVENILIVDRKFQVPLSIDDAIFKDKYWVTLLLGIELNLMYSCKFHLPFIEMVDMSMFFMFINQCKTREKYSYDLFQLMRQLCVYCVYCVFLFPLLYINQKKFSSLLLFFYVHTFLSFLEYAHYVD